MVRDERRVALVPATDLDYERVQKLPHKWPLDMHARFNRTSKLNRWYRGLVAHVADGIGVEPEALHCDLKLKAGLIERVLMFGEIKGAVAIQLRSTAFPKMQDHEFDAYCTVAVELLFRDYLPRMSSRKRQAQIAQWVGRRPALEPPPKLIRG